LEASKMPQILVKTYIQYLSTMVGIAKACFRLLV